MHNLTIPQQLCHWLGILLAMVGVAAGASGCAAIKGYPKHAYDPKAEIEAYAPFFGPESLEPPQGKGYTAETWRNRVVLARLRVFDIRYRQFERQFTTEYPVGQTAVDWAVIGLGGAGALVGNLGTSQIISAISGGIVGAKGSVDKNIYYDRTVSALIAQMHASRDAIFTRIVGGLRQPIEAYPFEVALRDTDQYFFAGTIPGAIQNLIKAAGSESVAAQQKLEQLINVSPKELDLSGKIAEKRLELERALVRNDPDAIEEVKDAIEALSGTRPSNDATNERLANTLRSLIEEILDETDSERRKAGLKKVVDALKINGPES